MLRLINSAVAVHFVRIESQTILVVRVRRHSVVATYSRSPLIHEYITTSPLNIDYHCGKLKKRIIK